jgi:hypothetical protein
MLSSSISGNLDSYKRKRSLFTSFHSCYLRSFGSFIGYVFGKLITLLFTGHPWIKVDGEASDKPIDSAVLGRMKQFRAMNKLKKLALKVCIYVCVRVYERERNPFICRNFHLELINDVT